LAKHPRQNNNNMSTVPVSGPEQPVQLEDANVPHCPDDADYYDYSSHPEILTRQICQEMCEAFFQVNGLVEHHIALYEYFMDHSLPAIVKEYRRKLIFSQSNDHVQELVMTNLTISEPLGKNAEGYVHAVTPQECRQRGLTYQCHVSVDVTQNLYHKPQYDEERDLFIGPPEHRHIYENVVLIDLPVMVKSKYCVLSRLKEPLYNDESLLDQGGYFLVNGGEKIFISQIAMQHNTPLITVDKKKANNLNLEIRSYHEDKIRSTSTMTAQLLNDKAGSQVRIEVRVPFVKVTIPLPCIFRLMGVETKPAMLDWIQADPQDDEAQHIRDLAAEALHDNLASLSVDALRTRIGTADSKHKPKKHTDPAKYIAQIMDNEFLPHMGLDASPETRRAKIACFGLIIRKFLRVHAGLDKPHDRDHLGMKRVRTAGIMMALNIRQFMRMFLKNLETAVRREDDKKPDRPVRVHRYMSSRFIGQKLRKGMQNGNWSVTQGGQNSTLNGVVQKVVMMNPLATLSHARRAAVPLAREGKAPGPRQLPLSHMGLMCPCETPEGKPCGLILNYAQSEHVRLGVPTDLVLRVVLGLKDVTPLAQSSLVALSHHTKLIVNGVLAGTTDQPTQVRHTLALMKQHGDLSFDASLVHKVDHQEIHVNTDEGCVLQPFIVMAKLAEFRRLYQRHHADLIVMWTEMRIAGVLVMMDKEQEEQEALVCMTPWDLVTDPRRRQYTHCVLHPAMMLGVAAAQIPYSDKNPAPRNMYGAGMAKQATARSAGHQTQVANRIEMVTGQKPLVQTSSTRALKQDQVATGENVLLAIAPLDGMNQDDSVILNKRFLDLGGFRTLHFTLHKDQERHSNNDTERFERPDRVQEDQVKQAHLNTDYGLLDDNGLVSPGSRVHENQALIGKTMRTAGLSNRKSDVVVRDRSTVWQHPEQAVVDKVLLAQGSKPNSRYSRVVLRSMRTPEMGDKFASRHAQKGVNGRTVAYEDMPFTEDNRVPDVIINSHCIPSRMTIGHLIEMLFGSAGVLKGELVNGTAFEIHDPEAYLDQVMKEVGTPTFGNTVMYSGGSGIMQETPCFMGVIFYQRLKHMVTDKMHARARGPRLILTRQPAEGRARDGGLRFGEMERDNALSHGAPYVLADRLCLSSDKYLVPVCRRCGLMGERGRPVSDRMYSAVLNETQQNYCRNCDSRERVPNVLMPYAFKLLVEEMAAAQIAFELKPSDEAPRVAGQQQTQRPAKSEQSRQPQPVQEVTALDRLLAEESQQPMVTAQHETENTLAQFDSQLSKLLGHAGVPVGRSNAPQ